MTIERRMTGLLALPLAMGLGLALGLGFLTSCGSGRSAMRGGLPREQVSNFPPNVQASYQLFAARCSRCHTLSRPLNAAITEHAHWESYVARMRRHAGSGISRADGDKILVFLKYHADQVVAEQQGGTSWDEEQPPEGGSP